MQALRILDVKKCMNDLLAADVFDEFLLSEAVITTRMCYRLDGHLTEGYLTEEEKREEGLEGERCVPYGYVRRLCFDMIKGKRKPESFHFTFLCSGRNIERLLKASVTGMEPREIANLTMNLKYVKEELVVTSACTMTGFSMDRTVELLWDESVRKFFANNGIATEKMV